MCDFNDIDGACAACCVHQLEDIGRGGGMSLEATDGAMVARDTALRAKARGDGMSDDEIDRGFDLASQLTRTTHEIIAEGMAPEVRRALARFDASDRHGSALAGVTALARYEDAGYDGATAAIGMLGRWFLTSAGERRRPEWDRMVRDARALVARTPGRTGRDGFGG